MFEYHVKTEDGQEITVNDGLVQIVDGNVQQQAYMVNEKTIKLTKLTYLNRDSLLFCHIQMNIDDLANMIYFLRKSYPHLADLRLD